MCNASCATPVRPHRWLYRRVPRLARRRFHDTRPDGAWFEQATLNDAGSSAELVVSALDQAGAAVVITDRLSRVAYANRAAGELIGRPVEWLRGRHFAVLMGEHRPLAEIDDVAAGVAAGRTWSGTMTRRRLDGKRVKVKLTLSPVRSSAGEVSHVIALIRDIEQDEEIVDSLAATLRQQGSVVAALAQLDASQPAHVLAGDVASTLLSLDAVTSSRVIAFGAGDRGELLAQMLSRAVRGRLTSFPPGRSRELRARAAEGAWVEPSSGTARATAYAPLRHAGRAVGLLAVETDDPRGVVALERQLGALSQVGVLASGLLGAGLAAREHEADLRAEIERVIDERAFVTVFQPMVRLIEREPFGFEALTRFSDGVPPERRFDDAHSIGLGVELEIATLSRALEAAQSLPPDASISVNLSPRLVMEQARLAPVLSAIERPLILEVTEREPIDDYVAFRRAVSLLGRVAWAVDDAGAGYASLRHIIELRPDFVKLDHGLVSGIPSDPIRQALVAGMLHFATSIGVRIIAEGVETEAERLALHALGVELAQGYLFGRPERFRTTS
jgi:PAS domain S-box-containing protein